MVSTPSYTQDCAALCTVNFSLSLYHVKFITFGCQSALRFVFPLYVSSVVFVHGADAAFDAIPLANKSVVKIINNKNNSFFISVPFLSSPLARGVRRSREVSPKICLSQATPRHFVTSVSAFATPRLRPSSQRGIKNHQTFGKIGWLEFRDNLTRNCAAYWLFACTPTMQLGIYFTSYPRRWL